jgi:hypothetical protein
MSLRRKFEGRGYCYEVSTYKAAFVLPFTAKALSRRGSQRNKKQLENLWGPLRLCGENSKADASRYQVSTNKTAFPTD